VDEETRLPILAVLGAADATADEERVAEDVGALAARHGWVVLTGGGPGVMAAACRGAVAAGGLTVGILPNDRAEVGYPNRWVRIPVFTGAGRAAMPSTCCRRRCAWRSAAGRAPFPRSRWL